MNFPGSIFLSAPGQCALYKMTEAVNKRLSNILSDHHKKSIVARREARVQVFASYLLF